MGFFKSLERVFITGYVHENRTNAHAAVACVLTGIRLMCLGIISKFSSFVTSCQNSVRIVQAMQQPQGCLKGGFNVRTQLSKV